MSKQQVSLLDFKDIATIVDCHSLAFGQYVFSLNEHVAYKKRRGPRAEVIIVTFKIDKSDKDG